MQKKIITYCKVLMRSVLFVSVPYTLLFILVDFFAGNPSNYKYNLMQGFAFAILLSIIIAYNRNRAQGVLSYTKHNADSQFTSHVMTDNLLSNIKAGFKHKVSDIKTSYNLIELKTEPSFLSWGERVKILHKTDTENGSTLFRVISQSLLRSNFLDKKKNQANLDKIKSIIESL